MFTSLNNKKIIKRKSEKKTNNKANKSLPLLFTFSRTPDTNIQYKYRENVLIPYQRMPIHFNNFLFAIPICFTTPNHSVFRKLAKPIMRIFNIYFCDTYPFLYVKKESTKKRNGFSFKSIRMFI